jgi:hypothetical protein
MAWQVSRDGGVFVGGLKKSSKYSGMTMEVVGETRRASLLKKTMLKAMEGKCLSPFKALQRHVSVVGLRSCHNDDDLGVAHPLGGLGSPGASTHTSRASFDLLHTPPGQCRWSDLYDRGLIRDFHFSVSLGVVTGRS